VLVARRDPIGRILLGEDGSKSAAAAAATVRRWAVLHGARIKVLSVADIDPQWNPWLMGAALREAHAAGATRLHEQHEELARKTAAGLKKAGLQTENEVNDGNPAHRLVETAVNWDADLIVLGTHGRSGLGALLVGSVARAVLYPRRVRSSLCPYPATDLRRRPRLSRRGPLRYQVIVSGLSRSG
jgi:nucleotide-binding universal stress UspA family protein